MTLLHHARPWFPRYESPNEADLFTLLADVCVQQLSQKKKHTFKVFPALFVDLTFRYSYLFQQRASPPFIPKWKPPTPPFPSHPPTSFPLLLRLFCRCFFFFFLTDAPVDRLSLMADTQEKKLQHLRSCKGKKDSPN